MPSGHEGWFELYPPGASLLTDARLQLHHAVQLATAAGISYLPAAPDDSHTNLEWIPELRALLSARVPGPRPIRVGIRVPDLNLLVTDGNDAVIHRAPLGGRVLADAAAWLKDTLASVGLDATRFTPKRHYEIPSHPVATGAAFRVDTRAFEELTRWFGDGDTVLRASTARTTGADDVRCWPHHFDIATLIHVAPGRTVGVGLEPGDGDYAEPYFYVNLTPPPAAAAVERVPLAGNGHWHTSGWIGAVLPGTRLGSHGGAQEAQVREFIDSAVAACRQLLG